MWKTLWKTRIKKSGVFHCGKSFQQSKFL
jgi:hypothetical protein